VEEEEEGDTEEEEEGELYLCVVSANRTFRCCLLRGATPDVHSCLPLLFTGFTVRCSMGLAWLDCCLNQAGRKISPRRECSS
jgi:hypothetical protein